jgi:hypothetical protein
LNCSTDLAAPQGLRKRKVASEFTRNDKIPWGLNLAGMNE